MKRCPNPDCPSSQLNRAFYDDDTVCPRCGEVLVNPTLAAGSTPTAYTSYTGTARTSAASSTSHGLALLGAVATILLVFLIIGLLRAGNMIGLGTAGRGTVGGGSTSQLLTTAQATATAHALATAIRQGAASGDLTGGGQVPPGPSALATPGAGLQVLPTLAALPTPLGGYSPVGDGSVIGANPAATPGGNANLGSGTGTLGGPSNPQTGGSTGTGGITGATAGNGSMSVTGQLCRRAIAAGQICDPTTVYGTNDTFALAVQATFGPSAAQRIRVRLSGPPNPTVPLLPEQINTPGLDGRYWVGFAFQPTKAWTPGTYRADIYVNDSATAVTFVTWNVQ